MNIVIQKYGGSSVADIERIQKVAARVVACREAGNRMVVVVSAMGNTTDDLLRLAKEIDPEPAKRELDMLLSVGERISMTLLSLAIHRLGREAISFTGSQCGIITNDSHSNARIIEVRPYRIQEALEQDRIVIVGGYQGVSYKREVTTLGRGGSDTTAVALAAALQAERCEIYTDVEGVFPADPRLAANPGKLDELPMDEMAELATWGAQVLHSQAVVYAQKHGIKLQVKPAYSENPGTLISSEVLRRAEGITGIASEGRLAAILLPSGDVLELLPRLGALLSSQGLVIRELVVPYGNGGCGALLLPLDNVHNWPSVKKACAAEIEGARFVDRLGALSLIGPARNRAGPLLTRALEVMEAQKAPLKGLSVSSLRMTFLTDVECLPALVKAMHEAFF